MELTPACLHCGTLLSSSRRSYCCDAHTLRAFRRRKAGLGQDAYLRGARRGRVPLGQPTRRELALALPASRARV
jgi:hypothetical protein